MVANVVRQFLDAIADEDLRMMLREFIELEDTGVLKQGLVRHKARELAERANISEDDAHRLIESEVVRMAAFRWGAQPAERPADVDRVTLDLTLEQARVVESALDVYAQLCLGKMTVVAEMVRDGRIPMRANASHPRTLAPAAFVEQAEEYMQHAKEVLGYSASGSMGVGHAHVHASGHRAYETLKALSRALAVHQNPQPEFRNVRYDGLPVRYTSDPAPIAVVRPKM